ncbi:hypothetical protein ACIHFD_35965 [Nonomuraea sp. NPDC051941]
MIYYGFYFKYGWESGIILVCADVPELIDTVALGQRYPPIFGPKQK